MPPPSKQPSGGSAAASGVLAEPQLQVIDPVRRVGPLRPGARSLLVFRLGNRGWAPLQIREVRPACPCLQVIPGSRSIAAGGRGKVEVVLRTDELRGHVYKTLELVTNDPLRPVVRLGVDAQVREVARLYPGFVEERSLRQGATAVRRVRVVPTDEAPGLRVLAVRSPHPGVRARALQREADGSWWFELELQGLVVGEQTVQLEVLTDHALEPRLPLWVRVSVRP